ncbi:LytTR family DNA-binding domain-containing protein [Roseovarius sp. EL26]|uniref:LytTR family DNA-binding domain-containing protein n=1 Tax=Roseovarius sp. EL26 TaxID=2126672 RepID=UPI0013C43E2A|nr:LytTR family DNA-binding domain-containing protein [Roseovarius sp. EL26]
MGIIIATIAGPFGTFHYMDMLDRFVFWAAIISVGVIMAYSFRFITLMVIRSDEPYIVDACIVILMTFGGAPVLWWIGQVTVGGENALMFGFSSMLLYVGLISISTYLARRFIPGLEAPTAGQILKPYSAEAPVMTHVETVQPRLLRRLQNENATKILRLSAKDHLVEVVTDAGTETLRMRLIDAIEKMEPIKGYCSHRSHWIAEDAIESVERENGQKIFLVLSNGDRIPVSRKYRPELEAAGIV